MMWVHSYTKGLASVILDIALFGLICFGSKADDTKDKGQAVKKNVLFIVVDDLRPELGPWIGKDFPSSTQHKTHTPNIDSLAKRSLILKRAYTQMSLCSPSRTSFLTGRRPDTTHVFNRLTYFRSATGNFTTIPQYFKNHGYLSIGMGKIFHHGKVSSNFDDPPSWSDPSDYYRPPDRFYWGSTDKSWEAVPKRKRKNKPLPDESVADEAVKRIKAIGPKAKSGEQPFFLAVGFYKPHLPFVFPKEYLKLYPLDHINLPENNYAPVDMPPIAWSPAGELFAGYKDLAKLHISGAINTTIPDGLAKSLRRAYFCSVAYIDDMVGKVLNELDKQGLRKNTVVSFIGDHGWKLGEHGAWSKHTNFELDTRTPMMISVPGLTDGGKSTEKLAELVDLYPTLVESAGLPSLPLCPAGQDSVDVETCTEGLSLMPLIKDPKAPWKDHAFSQYDRHREGDYVMGYSLRTDRYRYTEWVKYDKKRHQIVWDKSHGTELYDHKHDPEENKNEADNSDYQDVRENLSDMLRKGWRADIQSFVSSME